MAKILYDRYADVRTESVVGDGVAHSFTIYPGGQDYVLVGAYGSLAAGGEKLPVALESVVDHPTHGTGNAVIFHATWDDGQGGTGTAGTLQMTAFFAKTYEIFP
jgi:hypothetical protein